MHTLLWRKVNCLNSDKEPRQWNRRLKEQLNVGVWRWLRRRCPLRPLKKRRGSPLKPWSCEDNIQSTFLICVTCSSSIKAFLTTSRTPKNVPYCNFYQFLNRWPLFWLFSPSFQSIVWSWRGNVQWPDGHYRLGCIVYFGMQIVVRGSR